MGNFAFQGPLCEDMTRFKTVETFNNAGSLLAIGSMPTASGRQDTNKPVPFLASATGVSGESLRLTVADQTAWEWGDGKDASLQLSVIDPLQSEREISWATDGLPITQVKYAEGLSNQVNVRWLLVQKSTSTTILQPEHHPVPITETQIMAGSIAGTSAALVKANPILRLHHTDTGGNAHADVVFSPAAFGQAPLLALIDECGFWSIWDVMGTYRIDMNSVRVMLRACGQIDIGPLDEFPTQHRHPAEKHGLVMVCKPLNSMLDPLETETRAGSIAWSAPVLLMWKADQLQAVNMHSATVVSPLKRFWAPEGKNNRIIDVQNCPGSESRVFILTEKNLVWAEIRQNRDYPTVFVSIPHVGGGSSIPRMTTCALDNGTAMVFTFCTKTSQLSVYWFKAGECGPVRWHRHVTSLPSANDVSRSSQVSQLTVTPLPLDLSNSKYPSGLGAQYKRDGVEFFQVNILFDDLSLRYGIYTTVHTPGKEVVLPTKRLAWSMTEQQRQWKKRRDHFLQHFENTFVLPDGMTEKELASALQRRGAGENELVGHKESETKVPQPVRLNMERLCRSIGRTLAETQRAGPKGLPRDLFDAIQDMFNHSEAGSRAPLATWYAALCYRCKHS